MTTALQKFEEDLKPVEREKNRKVALHTGQPSASGPVSKEASPEGSSEHQVPWTSKEGGERILRATGGL